LQEPLKKHHEDRLKLAEDDQSSQEDFQSTCFDGGSTPPPVQKNSDGLWLLLICGLLMMAAAAFFLTHDPAAETYRQYHFTFGNFRVSSELVLLAIGCGCTFTPLTLLFARHKAGAVERKSGGRIKSMKAKRLEKVSEGDILSIISNYVENLFRAI